MEENKNFFEIRGEYWIVDGQAQFADQDVGDTGHEGSAIEAFFNQHVDTIISLAEEMDIEFDADEINRYDNVNLDAVSSLISEIIEKIEENDEDPAKYLMQYLNIPKEGYMILIGSGDPVGYFLKYAGWIAVRGNNIELYDFIKSKTSLTHGLGEIMVDEDADDEDDLEVSIYDYKTKNHFETTLSELEEPTIHAMSTRSPATNKGDRRFTLAAKDTEENMPSQKKPSSPNKLNVAAKSSGIIGPGQNLWRGTSESTKLDLKQWIKNNYDEGVFGTDGSYGTKSQSTPSPIQQQMMKKMKKR